jgi:hypothetical protein
MALYIDNITDPLALLKDGRELDVAPHHFIRIPIRTKSKMTYRPAHNWIWKNLVGRFSAGENFFAFEDPAEASMFAIVCDRFTTDDNFK